MVKTPIKKKRGRPPKRARTPKGKFKADNAKTPLVNEAYSLTSIKKNWKIIVISIIFIIAIILGNM